MRRLSRERLKGITSLGPSLREATGIKYCDLFPPDLQSSVSFHWLNPTRSQRKKSRIRGVNEDMEPSVTSRTQAALILERNLPPKTRLASFLKEEELGTSVAPAPVVILLPC